METQLLSRIIKDLLRKDGFASLPGFGMFRVEMVPACFSDRGFTINPPYLKVVFIQENSSDSKIADCYAQANSIGIVQAQRIVADAVERLRQTVMEEKNAELPGLGKLRATRDGTVFFVMSSELAISPTYDLLSPVSLKSLDYDQTAAQALEPQEAQSQTSEPQEAQAQAQASEPQEPQAQAQAPEPQEAPQQPIKPLMQPINVRVRMQRKHPSNAKIMGIIILSIIIFLGVLAIAGRLCPNLVDHFLYLPKEIEIIRYPL